MEDKNDKYVGTTVGIYEVMFISGKNKDGHKNYHIKCIECGYEKDAPYKDFYRARVCKHIGIDGKYRKNNGRFKNKRIFVIFNGIKKRCYNENNKTYRWYGAKGIKICDEWMDNPSSFEEWALNNGYADDLTIDRIDANRNYCPENCRWISREENSKHTSITNFIDVDGEIHSGKDWARLLGFGKNIINKYIRKYGLENTVEFIKKYRECPEIYYKEKENLKKQSSKKRSIYSLYMT